jgi:hypothetical protein
MYRAKINKTRGIVPPWNSGLDSGKARLPQEVVLCSSANGILSTPQKTFNLLPPIILHPITPLLHSLKLLTQQPLAYNESE